MKLVLMTQPTFFVEEDKILTSLFEAGLDNLHLFKPDSSPMERTSSYGMRKAQKRPKRDVISQGAG